MTQGSLAALSTPPGWRWEPLWAVAPRVKVTGQPEAEPLSVFLGAGVVPRASRQDNHNSLGEDLGKYLVVAPGDLVFNKLRTWQGGFGVSEFAGIVSPAYYVCRPSRGTHPRFLHHLLRSSAYLAELTRLSKFMPPSQFDMPWDNLRSLPLLLSPLDEQRRIAEFLDAETARIDRLIELRQQQRSLAEERRFAALSQALAPPALTKSCLPALPWLRDGAYPLIKLGQVARLQTGLTVDASRSGDGAFPYLRVANVQGARLDLTDIKTVSVPTALAARSMLRPGDVLMTEGGDLDKLGRGTVWSGEIEHCLHQNHVFALRPNRAMLLPSFLALMTRTHHARCYFESTGSRTTNLASTNSSKILAFRVPLPPIEVQRSMVEVQATADAHHETLRTAARRQESLLRERRASLITAAVTGQLDVVTARGAA